MRIDYSNEPGYWDKIVNKAASKRKRSLDTFDGNHKRWLEDAWQDDLADHRRGVLPYDELHKRWFGSDIIEWLKGLVNGVSDQPIIASQYSEDFTVILLNEIIQGCPIGPAGTTVSGKLDVRASTHVEISTSFGFTLITTLGNSGLVSFKDSYLYFNNRGKVSAKFTADAVATAQFDSEDQPLFGGHYFGAPFAVPGIVTIGPSFKLFGAVKGQLTLGAYFEANVNLADWDIRQTYPDQGAEWDPKPDQSPNRDGTQDLFTPEWQYGVSASGFVEFHVKPTITFGIEFNKHFLKAATATVNLIADGWVRFHADASHNGDSGGSSSTSFCYGVDAGADLTPANTATEYKVPGVLEKRREPVGPVIHLGIQCPLGNNDGDNSLGPCPLCDTERISQRQTGETCELVQGRPDESTCAANILDSSDLDASVPGSDAENITENGHYLRKRAVKSNVWYLDPNDLGTEQILSFNKYPSCNSGDTGGLAKWFGFDQQGMSTPNCPTTVEKFTANKVDTTTYQTDHILETQTLLQFFDFLRGGGQFNLGFQLPKGYTAATNDWVNDVLLYAETGSFNVEFIDGKSVWRLITDNAIGGESEIARSRMALVFKGINRVKGVFFQHQQPQALDQNRKVRASKIAQRNTAGVFGYMRRKEISTKFQASGQMIEAILAKFDAQYAWGSHPGDEPGRPTGTDRGLRDIWAYWIDVNLATIEAHAKVYLPM
ncbi:hypothetical protein F4678DRAFT_467623 [Xylaria arbuscula]|nr:hypothetical protein F4678DRAFT_467623 [Xylaria arbuscula]